MSTVKSAEVGTVKSFSKNIVGRDVVVGDIHGHFTRLQDALDLAGFNPEVDRLFSVGDLVDRGPECEDVIKWLNKPWFHPVRGNHDDYVVRFDTCDIVNWMQNGGSWFVGLPLDEQQNYQVMFSDLPIAIEVETHGGMVGIIHADCVFDTWAQLKEELQCPKTDKRLKLVKNTCMWSRSRIEQHDCRPVSDVRAVIVGHTPIQSPLMLGNTCHIDTGGWKKDGSGHFTLLDLATLQPLQCLQRELV